MNENNDGTIHIKKNFGVGVLLKLTKKNVLGLQIDTVGDEFVPNVSLNELNRAVDQTLQLHHIKLKV